MKKTEKHDFNLNEINDGSRSEKLKFDESNKKEKMEKTNEHS